jgi:hypothetical protein
MEPPPPLLLFAGIAYNVANLVAAAITLVGLPASVWASGRHTLSWSRDPAGVVQFIATWDLLGSAAFALSLAVAAISPPYALRSLRRIWVLGGGLFLVRQIAGGVILWKGGPGAASLFGRMTMDDVCCCGPVGAVWWGALTWVVANHWLATRRSGTG